jgi:dTDP-4-dehydrorhamnose 3,5-epimerase
MAFHFTPGPLAGLVIVKGEAHTDRRGEFRETFKASEFAAAGIPARFVQDNSATSARGVVRGLHFQFPPHAQGKLIRVARGRVWDLTVDIRRDSPTFGKWCGMELSGDDFTLLWIPPGFAHGYLALADDTVLEYKCTAEYAPASEAGVRWDDPDLAIAWPVLDIPCLVSARDAGLPAWERVRHDLDHRQPGLAWPGV